MPAEDVEALIITALIQDQSETMGFAISNGLKFDPASMGKMSVKVEYGKDVELKQIHEILTKAGEVVLRKR